MTRRPPADRGSVSLEVVVLTPILIMVATFVLQLGVAGWTASQTERAARQAARAQSMGDDPRAAADRALPGALSIDSLGSGGESVSLRVKVPRVSVLPQFSVERDVAMPDTQ